jgi:hypothetical protein
VTCTNLPKHTKFEGPEVEFKVNRFQELIKKTVSDLYFPRFVTLLKSIPENKLYSWISRSLSHYDHQLEGGSYYVQNRESTW